MKVPFTTQTHQSPNAKVRTTSFNEPKSVLDLVRCSSPSPAVNKPTPKSEVSALSESLFQSDDGSLHSEDQILNNLEDWDSLMRELGLHDDSARIPQFNHLDSQLLPEFPPSHSVVPTDFSLSSDQFHNHNFNSVALCNDFHHMNNDDFHFVDDLIRAADCFESNELQLAGVILERLNHQLPSPTGKALQRAAFYFKEALLSLLTGSTRSTRSSEVVQAIKAYKNFANVSPIIMFSTFTANQAILEAVDGSMLIHVVDFDIGFGGQWASFMREVADRAESRRVNSPSLRITAVVPEEYGIESRLIRDNLNQFACDLKIGFEIEFVLVQTFEFLSFKAIRFINGEKTAVLLSPSIFQRIGAGFLNDLRQISPHVVVLVDAEGMNDSGTPSFRRSVIDGLEFYSTVMESLEAASVGGGDDWIRRIEIFLLRPKIFAAVEAARRRAPSWREAFAAAGLRAVVLSQFADFQAECLLSEVQVRGFDVAKRQAEMVLCWQQRALVATSAWRC
ncbi:Scarecrow-like protein [Actinidia chinensis var. chinensis]|uniref:Scarecrow-like protein n=1 Tax=Actinidia chinensis var. chinensis TaxID=1590841 RepID=A0A2R6PAL9_ACTCC|nr:Scarecrow-like protein [Actinidia chinensis var. chinensis]